MVSGSEHDPKPATLSSESMRSVGTVLMPVSAFLNIPVDLVMAEHPGGPNVGLQVREPQLCLQLTDCQHQSLHAFLRSRT